MTGLDGCEGRRPLFADDRVHEWTAVTLCGIGLRWQVFTERGFVTRVLMASFDVGKLKELDEQLSKILGDMQVCITCAMELYI